MIPQAPACYQSVAKPIRLSDPGSDFTKEKLTDLLQKDAICLSWNDFHDLFGPFLPAGTYEELRYYVPYFVQFLGKHADHRLELVTSWAGFSSYNWNNIIEDKCSGYIQQVHLELLKMMTQEFVIRHYDKDGCRKKGWGLDYFDYVDGSESVNQFLSDLWRFETHRDIVYDFIDNLSEFNDDLNKCGWFVELSRSRFDVYNPPNDDRITRVLSDTNKLESALGLVIAHEIKGTYWDDAFTLLGV